MGNANDLMGYLLAHYKDANPNWDDDEEALQKFVDFSRNHLKENQPVAFDYMSVGMGMKMKNGEHISFLENTIKESPLDKFYNAPPGYANITDTSSVKV